MAFTVRIFGYRGFRQLPDVLPQQFAADSVRADNEPYEWRQSLVSNGVVAVSTVAQAAPDHTKYIRVEVPDGEAIRYEFNPPNRTGGVVVASADSPILSGLNRFEFFQGWTFSMIDATGT